MSGGEARRALLPRSCTGPRAIGCPAEGLNGISKGPSTAGDVGHGERQRRATSTAGFETSPVCAGRQIPGKRSPEIRVPFWPFPRAKRQRTGAVISLSGDDVQDVVGRASDLGPTLHECIEVFPVYYRMLPRGGARSGDVCRKTPPPIQHHRHCPQSQAQQQQMALNTHRPLQYTSVGSASSPESITLALVRLQFSIWSRRAIL